jgi:hypothetical protein
VEVLSLHNVKTVKKAHFIFFLSLTKYGFGINFVGNIDKKEVLQREIIEIGVESTMCA